MFTISMMMHTRENVMAVNTILHKYADMVIGRLGLPNHEQDIYTITVVVNGEEEKVNNLIEDLKKIEGIKFNILSF